MLTSGASSALSNSHENYFAGSIDRYIAGSAGRGNPKARNLSGLDAQAKGQPSGGNQSEGHQMGDDHSEGQPEEVHDGTNDARNDDSLTSADVYSPDTGAYLGRKRVPRDQGNSIPNASTPPESTPPGSMFSPESANEPSPAPLVPDPLKSKEAEAQCASILRKPLTSDKTNRVSVVDLTNCDETVSVVDLTNCDETKYDATKKVNIDSKDRGSVGYHHQLNGKLIEDNAFSGSHGLSQKQKTQFSQNFGPAFMQASANCKIKKLSEFSDCHSERIKYVPSGFELKPKLKYQAEKNTSIQMVKNIKSNLGNSAKSHNNVND